MNEQSEGWWGSALPSPHVSRDVYVVEPVSEPIRAVVRPPGSKSATNRALILASLAGGGVSRLWGALEADDTRVMRDALRAFGVLIDDTSDPWMVLGTAGDLDNPVETIDVAASGTTARFITAVSALVEGPVVIDGTPRMRERPISDLTDALVSMGAEVTTDAGTPPLSVSGGDLTGGRVRIEGSLSSQFVSALLMIAPLVGEPVEIEIVGRLVSERYVDTTVGMMRTFGAHVERTTYGFRVEATGYTKTHLDIEADASAAVYPLVAAAISGGTVGVEGIPPSSTQPDLGIIRVLEQMGCEIEHTDTLLSARGPAGGRLRPVDVDMGLAPDASLALAVACLFAGGESRIRGLSTLRVKETDRLIALQTELRRLGADARIEGDDLVIIPANLRPTRIETYDDHRMAMSFALVGLVTEGIEILDPECVSKTWPGYFRMLEGIRG